MKKNILICALSLGLAACQTTTPRPQVMVPAPALREVMRGGAIRGLEDNSGDFTGMPGAYDLIEHVCVSMPITDMYGRYVRTAVSCH